VPERADECFVDEDFLKNHGYAIGDVIVMEPEDGTELSDVLAENTFTIVGYGKFPSYLSWQRGAVGIGTGVEDGFVFLHEDAFSMDVFTVIYATVEGAKEDNPFTGKYEDTITEVVERIEAIADVRCEIRYDEATSSYWEDVYEAEADIQEAEEKIADGEKEIADGEKELADAEAEIADAEKEIADGEKEIADAELEIADAEAEIADGEQKLLDAEKELADAWAEILEGEQELSDAEKELADAWAEILDGEKQLADAEEQLADAWAEILDGEQQIADAEKELADAWEEILDGEQQIADGEKELADALKELTDGEIELADAEQLLADNWAEFEAGAEEFAAQEQELSANEAAFAALKAQYEAMGMPLPPQFQAMEAMLIDGRQQIEAARQELSGAYTTLYDATEELEEARKELADGRKKYEEGLAELEDAKAELADGKKKYEEGLAELEDAKAELADGKKKYEEGLAEYEEAKTELADGKRKYEEGLAEFEDGKKELEDGKKEYAEGLLEYEDAVKELEDGKAELEDAKAELADARTEIEDGKTELADARAEVEDGKKELADARKELADGKKELEDGKAELADAKAELEEVEIPEWYVLDRNTVQQFVEFGSNAERIGNLGDVFPAVFYLVAALVSLTTMTRMIEEERTQIGTMKALGYGKGAIVSKYLWYSLSATLIGGVAGILVGSILFPWVIINAYGILYSNLPYVLTPIQWEHALVAVLIAVICTVVATLSSCYRELAAAPAILMRPVAPAAGKRVFLEYIKPLWNAMNFSWKATFRNLFRYKKRFFMTIFGIGGCMALLLVGFGLRDSIMEIVNNQYKNIWTYDASLAINDTDVDIENTSFGDKVENRMFVYEKTIDVESEAAVKSGSLFVPGQLDELNGFVDLKDRLTKEKYVLSEEGVIVTEKLAKMLEVSVGDTIELQLDDVTKRAVTVENITENYMLHYIYMSPALYEEVFGESPEYNQLYLQMKLMSEEEEAAFSREMISFDAVDAVTYVHELQETVSIMMQALELVVVVLIVAAGMLAFIVLYNLNNINIIERRRELATLKVLGFYDAEVGSYVYRENVLLTVLGIAAGVVMGFFLHRFVILTVEVDMLMFGRKISIPSYLYSVLLTIVFAVFVNFGMFFKLRKIDMVESLKSAE